MVCPPVTGTDHLRLVLSIADEEKVKGFADSGGHRLTREAEPRLNHRKEVEHR
jgi:hypothetical protein